MQLEQLRRLKELKKKGMEIYAPTPDELKRFRDKAIAGVKPYMEEKLGKNFVNEFLKSIEEIEQKIEELTK